MGDLKISKRLRDDPRLLEAAASLSCHGVTRDCHARHVLLGVTVDLWLYAETHLREDSTLPVKLPTLAAALGTTPEVLRALPADWLREREDGTVELPGYLERSPSEPEDYARSLARERKRRQRERERDSLLADPSRVTRDSHADVTRDERDAGVTPSVTASVTAPLTLTSSSSEVSTGKRERKREDARASETEIESVPGLDVPTWTRWLAYRRQIRKPIKPPSRLAAARALAAYGDEQAAVVEQSISNGWQGLFALKNGASNGRRNDLPVSRYDRAAQHLDALIGEAQREDAPLLASDAGPVRASVD